MRMRHLLIEPEVEQSDSAKDTFLFCGDGTAWLDYNITAKKSSQFTYLSRWPQNLVCIFLVSDYLIIRNF